MGDYFEMLVDVEVSIADAPALSDRILNRFREIGLITGDPNDKCVLGGTGYRPGPAVSELYVPGERELKFWTFTACGVEPRVGREFNYWALGPVWEGLTCPACSTHFSPSSDRLDDQMWRSIIEWMDNSGPALLFCPSCGVGHPIAEWISKPPIGFGHLAFRFWNWPRLDSSSWKLDIAQKLREITGHTIVRTYGRI
jgi:hypothetical protein